MPALNYTRRSLRTVKRAMKDPTFVAPVPCGSCHLCCSGNEQIVLCPPVDDPTTYQTEVNAQGLLVLQHQPNGDCIYLEQGKCSIHGRQPFVCRSFDCRNTYLDMENSSPEQRMVHLKDNPDARVLIKQGKLMQKQFPIKGNK